MKNTKNTSKNRPSFIRPLAVTAILSAASFVLQLLEFSLPFVPDFLKFDFSDLPALLGSFALGPLWGMAISLLKNCLHLPFSSSMFVGELSNFLLSAIFVGTAGIIYRRHKTKTTALVGGAVGSGASALLSLATNYFIVYPFYIKLFFGGDREALMSVYNRFLPFGDKLFLALVVFNLPFTLVKCLLVTILALLIYKPLSPLLKGKES